MEYEPVIGLEVHVQIRTKTKVFTRVPYHFGAEPNTLTNPVVWALPGALPVLNKEAVRQSVRAGLMLNCKIADVCKWDRKNYFYPDSPKNYQISQYDRPICIGGEVEIELPGPSRNVMGAHRRVKLTRIHLEEDVGKLTHFGNDSLVDYNRAGVPLMEIVSEPDLYSVEEVVAYLNALRQSMVAAGISDCDMEKGQMRCDANVSVRPKGSQKLGTRAELKNLNSISGVRNAVSYEIKRQIRALERGETIVQETRRWDAETGITQSMRSKEEAHDYRYFPDPDLMPVVIAPEQVERIRQTLPERPFDRQRRFMDELGLPYTVTSVLCPDRELADYFEAALGSYPKNPKGIANLVVNELLRELAAAGHPDEGPLPISQSKISPKNLARLVALTDEGVITKQAGKEVFSEMFASGEEPDTVIERKGLKQEPADAGELEHIVAQAIADNPKAVAQFKEGNAKAINAVKGAVMKATKGRANPQQVDSLIQKLIG